MKLASLDPHTAAQFLHKDRTCSQKPASDHLQQDSHRASAIACLNSMHSFVTTGKLQSKKRIGHSFQIELIIKKT